MANKDVMLSHRYAEEAKIAAAAAKLYSKNNAQIADEAQESADLSAEYANSSSSSASISQQYYEYTGTLGQWNVGVYASPPENRRDGSALQVGDIYKNTNDNSVYSYNSDGTWSPISYDLNLTRQMYDSGEELYRQGVDLYKESEDYFTQSKEMYSASEEMYSFSLSQSEVALTFAGDYASGPLLISSKKQEITYNNVRYYVSPEATVPFITSGNTATTWATDEANFVAVGDAVLRQDLASTSGYKIVGGFYSQEGDPTTSPDSGNNLDGRRGARGQFDVISAPWEPKGVAGITFGGDNGRGTFTIDERGMVRTSVWYKGLRMQSNVLLPVLQSLGFKSGPDSLEGVMLRMGSPDSSPTIFVDYDSSGLPVLGLMNAQQFGEYGYPNPSDEGYSYNLYWTRKQVQSAINTAISGYQQYFTYPLPSNDTTSHVWVSVAKFTTATGAGNANGVFKALITVSGNVFPNGRSYLISGNSRGLSSVSLTSSNVNSYFNITALDAPASDDANNVNYILGMGVVQSANTVTLYAKMPYSCAYSTIKALNVGFSGYVAYTPSAFTSVSTEPSGIIYLTTIKPYNSSNVTVSSDGTLMAASPIVRVATDTNTSDRADINTGGFNWSGSGAVNTEASSYSVTHSATGTYLIPDAKLATEGWQFKSPKSPTGGDDLAVVEVSDTDSGVQILVYERTMQISGSSVSIVKGDLMDVPSDSWVDVRLYETPVTY